MASKNFRVNGLEVGTGLTITSGGNINSSGIITASNFSGNVSSATYATNAGIATYATNAGIATYATNAGIATNAQGLTGTPNLNVGIVTATSFSGDGSALTGVVGSGSGVIVKDSGTLVGTAGTIDFGDNLTVSPISAGIVTVTGSASGGGSSQFVTTAAGIHTLSNVGIGTTNPTEKLTVVGVVSATSFSGSGTALTGIVTSIVAGTNVTVSGSMGQVTINSTASGSSSQFVTTAAGIHTLSNVGIGTTNPTEKLTVSGVTSSTSFYGDASYTVSGRWTLGADGTSNYTFVGIGFTQTTNDPVLYLARGRVYEFVNNSVGNHPFQIRVGNGGAAYYDGVTNNSAASGVIRFEVPFSAPNILYYQCTSHPGMGATIFVTPRNEPAVGVRTTVTATTSSIGAGATSNLNIDGFKTYSLLKVGISSAAWVVLYTDSTSRSNDASRSYLTDPTPGSGVIAEVRTVSSGISTFIMSPGVIGWNNDVSVASTIYARVTNNESSTSAGIGVTLTVVKLED